MIKKVRIDYSSEHAPGQLVMVCGPDGYIIFDRDKKRKAKENAQSLLQGIQQRHDMPRLPVQGRRDV